MVDALAESWGSVGKGISGEAKKPLEVEASNVVLGTELCAPQILMLKLYLPTVT